MQYELRSHSHGPQSVLHRSIDRKAKNETTGRVQLVRPSTKLAPQYICKFFGDGIYPKLPISVGPNSCPTIVKESERKDVENIFGCLRGIFKFKKRIL